MVVEQKTFYKEREAEEDSACRWRNPKAQRVQVNYAWESKPKIYYDVIKLAEIIQLPFSIAEAIHIAMHTLFFAIIEESFHYQANDGE